MYVIRREDQVNPFAVIAHVITDQLIGQAVMMELGVDNVKFYELEKLRDMDYKDVLILKCEVIEDDGEVVDWEIEVVKLVSYI